MKRMTLLLLALCLALSCGACAQTREEKTVFYYLRTEDTIEYGRTDALIAPVPQEISDSLEPEEIIQLYLDGPSEEGYRSPIPKGTYLLSTIAREDMLVIVLSREFSSLDGIQLTLAGACIAATCRDFTGLDRVQVRSGENVYDFNYNDYLFLDDSAGK